MHEVRPSRPALAALTLSTADSTETTNGGTAQWSRHAAVSLR